jgi:hypothetical protein
VLGGLKLLADKNEYNKKKIQKHIEDGNIINAESL